MNAEQELLEQPTAATIRDELERLVVADLHGPLGGPEEEFGGEQPTDRYLLGRLAPSGTMIEPDVQDEDAPTDGADLGEDRPEPIAPNITSLSPSAAGCTAYVAGDTSELAVQAEWACYERVASESDSGPARVWRRVAVSGSAQIALKEGELGPQQVSTDYPRVLVRGRARRHEGNWLVSLFLVNGQPKPAALPDSAWLFQVALIVTGPDRAPVFLPRPDVIAGGDQADRAEQRRLAMAYRASPEFAVGHGTGVHATPADGDPMRAVEIRTTAMPSFEIPQTGVPGPETDQDLPELADVVVDMKRLAAMPTPDLIAGLAPLVAGYRAWIDQQEAAISDPVRHLSSYGADAAEAVRIARRAADRIERGIELLATDEAALASFRFANRAMYLQRVHTMAVEERGRDSTLTLEDALARVNTPDNHS